MRLWPVELGVRFSTRASRDTASLTQTLLVMLWAISLSSTAQASVQTGRGCRSTGTRVVGTRGLLALCSARLVSASTSQIGASQRHFRIGHPGARITWNMTTDVAPQSAAFEAFESYPTLDPSHTTLSLVKDAMDLFSAKPSAAIFARSWSRNATFSDPICHAVGARQYLAQWYAMRAVFSESETLEWKLIRDEPTHIEYVQKQRYKLKALGTVKVMHSTVVMHTDAHGRITRFEDRWNHTALPGTLAWPFRRLNAITLPWLVAVAAESKNALT
ncbi:uncharacterized protein UMAG_10657 [Mycosarcoma maydis]|uniref:SnoaL-like domain-containing protein n=1 Tax=Mycosarcoma maydis TaxID=5270 RepID=A0A0D1C511_MYCMD|nr:uncharacterized protein UMAG_10657 [Ustilago maydis 521]KIS68772.1 hypothetical protein UMAG_10657 [Ustilago maydis 521]|eukprot:XP_011389808.1 hypothetical protein UMAG_10657 [Ustilago maydis 521]